LSNRASAVLRHISAPIAAAVAAVSLQAIGARRAESRARAARDLAEAQLSRAERDALTAKMKPVAEVFDAATELGKRLGWEECRVAGLRHGIVPGRREPRIMYHEDQDSEAS
jgi:hypothetical protein